MNKWLKIGFFICIAQCSSLVYADKKLLNTALARNFIDDLVKKEHVQRELVEHALRQAEFRQDIIDKMDKPYESKPWDVYAQLFLTVDRVNKGAEFWEKNKKTLKFAEKHYGVPAQVIVSILGVETYYGQRQGDTRVIDALTTLAFYYPKRADYFQYELKEYLNMCQQYNIKPEALVGSYAGAIGQGQFMPGSYRRWAVKFNGTGAPDIINNSDDAIVSVANYLQQHGWQSQQLVAQPAKLTSGPYKNIIPNLKKATYSYHDLVHFGVSPVSAKWFHPNEVGFLDLNVTQGHEYWIGYPNFYVILTYNSSPLYGLAVYLLSESIATNV